MPIERRVSLRGHPPSVPWDILASDYIDCVERGEHPGAVLRERYGISPKAWMHKRIWMSRRGWLPRGVPERGQAQFTRGWVARARRMVRERVREHAQLVLERERRLAASQQRRRIADEHATAHAADQTQRRTERRERRAAAADSAVLDVFL